MPHFASFARLGFFTTVAVVLASACGGQSFTGSDGGDAGSGAGSNAGSSSGGSTSRAGTSSTAGKGHAGSGTGGSSAGTGAGGGSAGTGVGGGVSEACGAPPSSGNCDAYIPSWYNEPASGICRPFVYGGCGGNANRYDSLEACQRACPGGSPNYDACTAPSDCMVTGTGCCGICDSGTITPHDLIAYNKKYAGVLQCGFALDVAGDAAGAAAPIACAPCPAPLPGVGTLQYFVPDCVAGQCVVADLRTSAVTACKSNTECKLRQGVGCCEGCGGGDTFSVRNDGSFEKLVCGDQPVACPACVPAPTGEFAYCNAGRCSVAIAADG